MFVFPRHPDDGFPCLPCPTCGTLETWAPEETMPPHFVCENRHSWWPSRAEAEAFYAAQRHVHAAKLSTQPSVPMQ